MRWPAKTSPRAHIAQPESHLLTSTFEPGRNPGPARGRDPGGRVTHPAGIGREHPDEDVMRAVPPDAMKPGFQCVLTHWNRGFMAFCRRGAPGTGVLKVPV